MMWPSAGPWLTCFYHISGPPSSSPQIIKKQEPRPVALPSSPPANALSPDRRQHPQHNIERWPESRHMGRHINTSEEEASRPGAPAQAAQVAAVRSAVAAVRLFLFIPRCTHLQHITSLQLPVCVLMDTLL